MARYIISIIIALILDKLLFGYLDHSYTAPDWTRNWWVEVIAFFVILIIVRYVWSYISGYRDRHAAGRMMKLDQDVRQAIVEKARIAGSHLAAAMGTLDKAGRSEDAEAARKARSALDVVATVYVSQPSGPGPASAGQDFGTVTAEKVLLLDKGVMAILEELADGASDIGSGSERSDRGAIAQIGEAARGLIEHINQRNEIMKGIK